MKVKRTFCKDCEHAAPTARRTMIWCRKDQTNYSKEFHWCDEVPKGPVQTNLPEPHADLDAST